MGHVTEKHFFFFFTKLGVITTPIIQGCQMVEIGRGNPTRPRERSEGPLMHDPGRRVGPQFKA